MYLQKVDANAKSCNGDTARSLALIHGHTKIVSLIDNHIMGHSHPLRSEAGWLHETLNLILIGVWLS